MSSEISSVSASSPFGSQAKDKLREGEKRIVKTRHEKRRLAEQKRLSTDIARFGAPNIIQDKSDIEENDEEESKEI